MISFRNREEFEKEVGNIFDKLIIDALNHQRKQEFRRLETFQPAALAYDLVPAVDDTYYLGSATVGWKGLHLATNVYLKGGTSLAIKNSADTALVSLWANSFYIGDTLQFQDDKALQTRGNIAGYVLFKGYGSGAYAEHARLAPNNFEIKNGKLTGALDCNSQNISGINGIDANSYGAPTFDDDWAPFNAKDNGIGMVQVGVLAGGADPFFGMGSNQGNVVKVTYSDKIGFFSATPVSQRLKASYNNWAAFTDIIDALVDLGLFDQA